MQKQKQNKSSSIKLLNLLLVLLLSFTAVMPQNLVAQASENKSTIEAELSIDFRDILRNKDSLSEDLLKKTPESGFLVRSETITLEEGSSSWDLVKKYLDENKVEYDVSGESSNVYIKGINGISEFDAGARSGWMYYVNGKYAPTGIGSYTLKDGDKIKLFYTVDYTKPPVEGVKLTITNDVFTKSQGATFEGSLFDSNLEIDSDTKTISDLLTKASNSSENPIDATLSSDKTEVLEINGVKSNQQIGENIGKWYFQINGGEWSTSVNQKISDIDIIKASYVIEQKMDISIKNDVYPKEKGAPWDGNIVNKADEKKVTFKNPIDNGKFAEEFLNKYVELNNIKMEGETGQYGFFIKSFNGLDDKPNIPNLNYAYWSFLINGNWAENGVSSQAIKAGDSIEFAYAYVLNEDSSTKPSTADEDVEFDKLPSTWPSFRGNSDNNAVRESASNSPLLTNSVEKVFAQKYAEAGVRFPKAPGQGIFVNNEYVFIIDKGKTGQLLAIDPQNGNILRTLDLPNGIGYATTTPLYVEGRIFLALDSGIVVSFPYSLWKDQKSFDEVPGSWIYDAENKNLQSQTPLTYADGKVIYSGLDFNNRKNKPAPLVALDANTGEVIWRKDIIGGFYFSGGIVKDSYFITGSEAQGLMVFDVNTGEMIDQYKIDSDIRSTIVRENNQYYVPTSAGELIKFTVSSEGKLSILYTVELGAKSTSTPVVYNDRLYIGVNNGKFLVFNTEDGSLIREISLGKAQALTASPLLVKHGKDAYVFFTVNNNSGILYGFVDNAKKTENEEPTVVYQADEDLRQYTRNSVFMGEDGKVYFSLDSGYLFAIKGEQPDLPEPTPEPEPEPTPEPQPEPRPEEPEPQPESEPTPEPQPEPNQPDYGSDNDETHGKEFGLSVETEAKDLDLKASLAEKPTEKLILKVSRKDSKALTSTNYAFSEVFDISLVDSTGKHRQPVSQLTITLRPNTEIDKDTVLVHEIIENGERRLEKVDYQVNKDNIGQTITFNVEHLSLFGLGKAVNNQEDGTRNSTSATSTATTIAGTSNSSSTVTTADSTSTGKAESGKKLSKTGAQSSLITATSLIALAVVIYRLRNKDEDQNLI